MICTGMCHPVQTCAGPVDELLNDVQGFAYLNCTCTYHTMEDPGIYAIIGTLTIGVCCHFHLLLNRASPLPFPLQAHPYQAAHFQSGL